MLSEPTCTSTTKASTTSSRSTSPSTKSRSRRPSRSASKLCATCSRRTRRVLEHRNLYAMYFYGATGTQKSRFPLPHLYPGAAIYKAAVVAVTVNANVIVNETHRLNPRAVFCIISLPLCRSLSWGFGMLQCYQSHCWIATVSVCRLYVSSRQSSCQQSSSPSISLIPTSPIPGS